MKTYRVTWEEVVTICDRLAIKLERGEYTRILAVSRGGLVPACLLAHRLNINRVESININKLDLHGPIDLIKYQFSQNQDKFLVVDEIVDTGYTFRMIRNVLPYVYYVALYTKPKGFEFADLIGVKIIQDTWLHFPWETT